MTEARDRVLKMLKTALDMEEKGRAFYEKAAKECSNKFGNEMFNALLNDEIVHVERIKKIYEALTHDHPWDSGWQNVEHKPKDLRSIFSSLVKQHKDQIKSCASDISALDVGLDFENKSVTFYENELKLATDPIEQEFIRKMIVEERGHHQALADSKLYLQDPAAWYNEHEKSMSDAG